MLMAATRTFYHRPLRVSTGERGKRPEAAVRVPHGPVFDPVLDSEAWTRRKAQTEGSELEGLSTTRFALVKQMTLKRQAA